MTKATIHLLLSAILLAASFGAVHGAGDFSPGHQDILLDARAEAMQRFLIERPGSDLFRRGDRIARVYGKSFSSGRTPEQAAERFLADHLAMFGVKRSELVKRGPFPDGRHVQPIMWDLEQERFRFTGLYYAQEVEGIPVFRSNLMLLMRNEAEFPLVLASADLRPVERFRVPQAAAAEPNLAPGEQTMARRLGAEYEVLSSRQVIWAGVEDMVVAPRLAVEQIVQAGTLADPQTYQKWLFLIDATTGRILFEENQIVHSITGNVSCRATQGNGADICGPVALTPMPYARVTGGGQTAYADVDGNYTLPANPGPVVVESRVRGLFFRVFNQGGSDAVLTQSVSSPGMANFIHNDANPNELTRAEVNAYYHANVARDIALKYNPAYPVIAGQTEFTVNVNLGQNCNAFYNGTSINFYTSGGGCANTAFSVVVHHEYGHHLVASGGSGQGAYGEGMSDCIGVIITDDPVLAYGFQGNCSAGIRNADNDCQYLTSGCSTCGSQIHACGQLLSGCVWSTRNELLATHPSTYRDTISNLTINSILLHTGTSINPSITIDFLTLDDDNDDIFDGTPHYNQINAGFGAHNMPAPPLDLIRFSFPNGVPNVISPGGDTTIRVHVEPLTGQPQAGTGMVHYRIGPGGSFTSAPMQQVSPNVYDAQLPPSDCGEHVFFYFSAQATTGETFTSPRQAPADSFALLVATDLIDFFADDFDDDLGWIAGAPDDDATTGHWVRAWPVGTSSGGQQAQPNAPFVGSACYITGQHTPGQGAGFNDVDNGKTTLFSPIMEIPDGHDAVISYWRWYSNHAGANPHNDIFVVDVSNNAGATWVNAETVGPAGPETMGNWYHHEFRVSDFLAPTDQVQVRFVASDYDPQALVEAAVDAFRVVMIECVESGCPDLNGDGDVDVLDLLILLDAWGACPGCAADLNGDGDVDVLDLLLLLDAWGPCP
jgi:hypothetical protein